MPTYAGIGAKVKAKYPEYAGMSDADVGAKVAAKYPEYASHPDPGSDVAGAGPLGVPDLPAHPAVEMAPRTLADTIAPNNPGEGQPGGYAEALRPVGNAGRRTVRNLTTMVTDPTSLLPQGPTAAPGYDPAHPSFVTPSATQGYLDTARGPGGITQALSDAAGDAGTMAVLDRAVPAAVDAAGSGLNAAGRGLKRAGALSSRLAIAAPAAEDALGADAGRALSSNRIVGASPRSLSRKVSATVDPAVAARDAVLAQSTADPTDVAAHVSTPFAEQTALKTDPVTGAAAPGTVQRLNTTRRVIQEETDPETGRPTGDDKRTDLSPLEMSQLQRNLYDMTDYTTPEGGPTNTALKGAAANLRGAIDTAAPEARPLTQNVHDLLGARDTLQSQAQGGGHGIPDSKTGLIKAAGTLAGTGAGAALDATGSGLMNLGAAVRRMGSPVAPTTPSSPSAPASGATPARAPLQLEGSTTGEAPGPGPEDIAPVPGPRAGSPVAPAPPLTPRAALPAVAEGEYLPHGPAASPASPRPSLNERTARNRTVPTVTTPRGQQVAPDQPGYVAPRGTRPLITGPDGTVTPQPYPLAAPATPPQLEARTGARAPSARPGLLAQLRNEMETAATPAYVPPVAQAEVVPVPPAKTAPMAAMPRPKLAARVIPTPVPSPAPAAPAPLGVRIPAPDDVRGWQALEDKGWAEYNVHTKQYDYTGPTNLTTKVKNAK